MISHEHKLIFVGIGKNASSSIVRFFSDLDIHFIDNRHSGVGDLNWYLNEQYKDCSPNYFKFEFVRNPFDRLFSAYREFNRPEQFHDIKRILSSKTFGNFIRLSYKYNRSLYLHSLKSKINFWSVSNIKRQLKLFKSRSLTSPIESFDSFVYMAMLIKHIHWQSQYETLFFKGHQLVDFIGKVENLDNDLGYVCNQLGIERTATVQRLRSSHKGSCREVYNEELIKIATEYHKDDLRQFGYQFDSSLD